MIAKSKKRKPSSIGREIPEKVLKTNHQENEGMEEDNNLQENDPADDVVTEERELIEEKINFSQDFKMSQFRKKLRGTDFITELRHFLHLAKKKPQIISKYIEKKGKPLELAEALERIDKSQLFHISYICQALQFVLMEILTNEKTHIESAVNTSRYILKSHVDVIEKLLKSSNVDNRKCILKLLTTIVCLEPQLGRQILTTFDVMSNSALMENLLSKSKLEIGESETVRKCFIHLMLSYMIDGNTLLIRNLLNKYNLINLLLSGLVYDDHITVCVVLNTLKKYVLESLEISKTTKIHIFDVANLKNIIKLYQWKGPNAFANMMRKQKSSQCNGSEPNSIEMKAVAQAAHEFLVLLLTSRKYGIAFDAMSNLRYKRNFIQGKILSYLDKPWLSDLKIELVIKIVTACPELARNTVKRYSMGLDPNKTDENWICVALFLEKLISELHPSILHRGLDKITITDFAYWIKDICICPEALFNLKGHRTLKSDNYSIRIATVKLLLAMFKQFVNYMNAILEREKVKGNDLRKFKFDILNHIFVNFPTIQNILSSLYKSIKTQDDDAVNILEHLEVTLDLILIISQNCRSFVDKTGTIVDYIEMLSPLYESMTTSTDHTIRIELKAVKAILLLVPQSLKPLQKHFNHVFQSFVNAFVLGSTENQKEAGNLLRGIFMNLKVFENATPEIDIWLEALKFISPECRNNVKKVLPKILQKYSSVNFEIPSDVDSAHNIQKNLTELFENIENDVAIQGTVEKQGLSNLLFMLYQYLHKSNESDESDESDDDTLETKNNKFAINEYLEVVSLLLFHYLPSPGVVLKMYIQHNEKHKKYMISWLDKQKPGKLQNENIPKYTEIYKSILAGEQNFLSVFGLSKDDSNAAQFILDEKEVYLSNILQHERLIFIYIHQITFIVAQLVSKSNFDKAYSESCRHYLTYFLKILFFLHIKDDNNEQDLDGEETTKTYLEQAIKYIYCNHLELLQNFDIFRSSVSEENFFNFICDITSCINSLKLSNFDIFTVHYRGKIINQLIANVKNVLEGADSDSKIFTVDTIKAFEIFQMSEYNCVDAMKYLSQLSPERFIVNNSNRSFYFDALIHILNRLSELKTFKVNNEIIINIAKIYSELVKSSTIDINLEKFEEAFHSFLIILHQSIPYLPSDVFSALFDARKITKNTIKLATLILERRTDLNDTFIENLLPKHISKKELIYPLLNVIILKRHDLDLKLLTAIYQEYKNGFLKTIEKPQKAGVIYKENVPASLYLIDKCMPVSECLDFCKKNLKADTVEVYQLKVIEKIYRKAIEFSDSNDKGRELIFTNFLNTLIQLFLVIFRRDYIDHAKIDSLSFMAYDWHTRFYHNAEYEFDKILNSQAWQHFCKNCLKLGMQSIEVDGQIIENCNDKNNSNLLKVLAFLCNLIYTDQSPHPDVKQLFEMIISHSRFLDIVLSQQASEVKTQLMHILLVLIQKNVEILDAKHIPILLGAYQAKLTTCDRYILAMLQFYEKNGISLYEFRPFIWGNTAIEHYSLKNQEENTNLQQQELSVLHVMSLIDCQTSDFTLTNFPIWRKLNTLLQIPETIFIDPSLATTMTFYTNKLENYIEAGITKFDPSFLRLYPEREEIYEECYDPAFIIPLMSMAFAPGMYSQPVRPVQNGLLAIVFAALSSQDKEMRLAAGCVQLRYRQHFENNKFFDRLIWIQTYDNIQNGLDNLKTDWVSHKKFGLPRVPFIPGLFLAKSINVLIDPTSPLYKVLSMYLRLKNAFNFLCIPEFNVLFHSPEIEHQVYRNFIVEVIREGTKCSSDLFLLISTNTFKALLGFYGSTMSNLEINLLILSVVRACCKIPASSKLMIEHVGIIPWLNSVIENVEYYQFNTIESLISAVNNLWYAVKAKECDFHDFSHIEANIFHLLIKIGKHISGRISLHNFVRFLNILSKTAAPQRHKAIDEEVLDKFINCAQSHFEDKIFYIQNIKINGADGIETTELFSTRLRDCGLNNIAILGLVSLRNIVVGWIKN